jgi:hypothetical protein
MEKRTSTGLLQAYGENSDALVRDFLDADKLDVAADYLSRGRNYGALGIEELTDKADEAAAAFVADLRNLEKIRALDDVKAEFRLRGLEPPLPSKEQLSLILDHVRRLIVLPEGEDAIEAALPKFLKAATEPN